MQVFCDFDGTISLKDTTDEILSRFAAPEWEIIEAEWKRGEIGSAECMRRQIALIGASKQTLDAALDDMQIDPTFRDFVRYCEASDMPLTIISDGVDYFIHRILKRYQLEHLPVIANHLTISEDGYFALSCPHSNRFCSNGAGVCKCKKINALPNMCVFVGDGRSDFCAASAADLLFAKSTLATYCDQQAIPYVPYTYFSDVQQALKTALPQLSRQKDFSLTEAFA